jgi:hypothetical protein
MDVVPQSGADEAKNLMPNIQSLRIVLAKAQLNGYIPNLPSLTEETLAWETLRNTQQATVDWRFTTDDARIKLKKLYPIIRCDDNLKESLPLKA